MSSNAPTTFPDALNDVTAERRELEKLRAQQAEIMRLLGTTNPDRLLHDIRNLLQERIFLLAACESMNEDEK